jgi:hypothetical protein
MSLKQLRRGFDFLIPWLGEFSPLVAVVTELPLWFSLKNSFRKSRVGDVVQEVEPLPTKCEVLSSNPSTAPHPTKL